VLAALPVLPHAQQVGIALQGSVGLHAQGLDGLLLGPPAGLALGCEALRPGGVGSRLPWVPGLPRQGCHAGDESSSL
jgi:hypothetical protein